LIEAMKVTCPSCQSKYTVADEKVRGKTVKIRCRKCSATILADGTSLPGGANGAPGTFAGSLAESAQGATSAVEGASEEATYHVSTADGEPRTMTVPEIVAAYNEGHVTQETYVWADGMADWLPLGQVEPLVSALHAASAAASVSAASIPDTGSSNVARRVERNDMRASRDLFVEAASQATSQEVVTSAPAYAPAPSSASPSTSSPSNPTADAQGAGGPTGQRGENSVLFSLAALTKDAETKPAAPQGALAKDDSGIIDLKALATAPAVQAPAAAPVAAPLFPLGVPEAPAAPLGAPVADSSKSKAMMFVGIGGGVAFLAAVVMVIVVMMKGNPPKEEPAAATTASAAPTASVAPTQVATAPTESAAPSATVAAKPPTVGGGGGKTSAKAGGGGSGGGTTSAKTTSAPQKPVNSDPCGCAGDLMCLMKCSTGKK
jgi:predicted Zn finger-like uncharacterized protein